MPENRTALSPHVQRLVDEKYSVKIEDGYIILEDVPYVSSAGTISRAAIISAYHAKDGVETFGDHTVLFTGAVPCSAAGQSLEHILIADKNPSTVVGRQVLCRFSYKSEDPLMMENIYNKLTHYVRKLQSYVAVIDSQASACGAGSISVKQSKSVFFYPNTAISRAGLDEYEKKLKLNKVAIVGLGGTGSYILDALAKTPVAEIHLYDNDVVDPATVFRMPGALTIDQAYKNLFKTEYFQDVYGRMRSGIESHPFRIEQQNIHELDGCDFIFIAIDHGPSRGLIGSYLVEKGIPFIDVGIGVDKVPEDVKLIARLRVTAVNGSSSAESARLPIADDPEEAVYNNIQVAELNALNAMLAIIVYKQKLGFYSEEIAVNALHYVLSWHRLLHRPENIG